ncbi:indigoidine synthase A-like protein [Pholiota conissans]|uniref:Indigoidine synthase A-like protein n=1 Tax=Pholiota conissans TaxID=109636 RepID=A0A9P5Z3Z3_9AGAR|nr:indigoidine synthase A-like protein [Pholiota conissans]
MPFLRGLKPPRSFIKRSLSSWSQLRTIRARDAPIDLHPEVEDALAHNKPVVALETALVTHGLPYPQSLEVPLMLEDVVRSTGAIPATIGILGGRVKVGLERYELDRLAGRKAGSKLAKVSRRDIAAAIALECDGGTTCSATLVFAALAGIKVFATGGLGGVHRGGENSMDVSADLQELTRCPVGLVSSGVKSILDIKRTLEYLETLGVPVISYGESREFPAFFSRHSGHNVSWNIEDPATAAQLLYTQWQLGLKNGALIAVPIPEEYEEEGERIQKFVNQAVRESEENGMNKSGKDATPWLLSRIAELTGGTSLTSNIALLKNTALVGGQIAVSYQKLANESFHDSLTEKAFPPPPPITHGKTTEAAPGLFTFNDHKAKPEAEQHQPSASVVVIGSAALDITAQEKPDTNSALARHSTAPGHVRLSLGGVARNIAEASHRIMQAQFPELSSVLLAPVGFDAFGHILVDEHAAFGMRSDGLVRRPEDMTAVCNMVLDSTGTLVGGVADMSIMDSVKGIDITEQLSKHKPKIAALDGNLLPITVDEIVQYCNKHKIPILFEPTSTIKSTVILPALVTALKNKKSSPAPIAFCTPNLLELTQLYETAQSESFDLMNHPSWWSTINSLNLGTAFRMDLDHLARKPVSDHDETQGSLSFLIDEGIAQKALRLLPFFQHIVIKCGMQGVVVAMRIDGKDAESSGWVNERSNTRQRHVVAHGTSKEIVVLQHIPSLPIEAVANVTGAGDSFVGALLATLANDLHALYHPKTLHDAILTAQKAAVLTLQSHSAVSPLLSSMYKN